jgi:hypothetical protein
MNRIEQPTQRRPGILLMTGLIVAPAIASWFLLRQGYSNQLRLAAFTWAAVAFSLGLIRLVLYQNGFR